jgi:hypothetical protein
MTRGEAVAAIAVAEVISRELDDDYVGLWKVAWHLRRKLGSGSDKQIRELAEVILQGLAPSGVFVGELSEETGEFDAWSEAAGIDRAINEWAELGRDPNIGEIAWLARS